MTRSIAGEAAAACPHQSSSSGTSHSSTSLVAGAYAAKVPLLKDPCTAAAAPPLQRTVPVCRTGLPVTHAAQAQLTINAAPARLEAGSAMCVRPGGIKGQLDT